jgi:hypothetical protein
MKIIALSFALCFLAFSLFAANWNIQDWAGTNVVNSTNIAQLKANTGLIANNDTNANLSGTFSGTFSGAVSTNTPVLKGFVSVAPLTNSMVTNSDGTVTPTVGVNLGYQPATNNPSFTTTSNPTNQYSVGVLYTNLGRKGFWRGYATGGTLFHTNSGVGYWIPVTNNFCEPISTNDTFIINGGTITNAILWQ